MLRLREWWKKIQIGLLLLIATPFYAAAWTIRALPYFIRRPKTDARRDTEECRHDR